MAETRKTFEECKGELARLRHAHLRYPRDPKIRSHYYQALEKTAGHGVRASLWVTEEIARLPVPTLCETALKTYLVALRAISEAREKGELGGERCRRAFERYHNLCGFLSRGDF